jgi:hypothetical protein
MLRRAPLAVCLIALLPVLPLQPDQPRQMTLDLARP